MIVEVNQSSALSCLDQPAAWSTFPIMKLVRREQSREGGRDNKALIIDKTYTYKLCHPPESTWTHDL